MILPNTPPLGSYDPNQYQMGQSVPKDMDGRVLIDILVPSYTQTHPVQYEQGKEDPLDLTEGMSYGKEDQRDIEERLRSLGYLD